MLKKIQQLGHEVTYHHDVMDFSKGNLVDAEKEYISNVKLFEKEGFKVVTVCQHGNPIIERKGYTSNRDFFRNELIARRYMCHVDLMVNFPERAETSYLYFSDAGKKFKLIYDPINNDRIISTEKDKVYRDLDDLYEDMKNCNSIISIHPHRWCSSNIVYFLKTISFKIVRSTAKLMIKIPFVKKIFGKYYYLAKKL